MVAKLWAPNSLSAIKTVRSIAPRPMEIKISGRLIARQWALAERIRIERGIEPLFQGIDVVLQAVMGNEGLHGSLAPDVARSPHHLDADPLQVGGVGFARRSVGDDDSPQINRAFIGRAAGGIIKISERGRNKAGLFDLVPTVKADGFHFFLKNLDGPQVFTGALQDADAL